MRFPVSRRGFLGTTAAAGLFRQGAGSARAADDAGTPALLGGKPVHPGGWPGWPVVADDDLPSWIEVLRSGAWGRLGGGRTARFEQAWADATGSQHALATTSGTTALFTALNALRVGPGDEVIVPPYTFAATVNAVFLQYALPIFVDTDPETFQIDATKVEAAITGRTACVMPVHIGGGPADLDTILEVTKRHKVPVIEDASQPHLAAWRGRAVGTHGDLGCFSFQASKNLNCGEGGAVLTQSEELLEACRSFHNNGRGAGGFVRNGCNLRLTEFQAAVLLRQLTRLDAQARTREANAAYLTSLLKEIPGITPAKSYEGTTRNAYHLYMLRYDAEAFAGLPRAGFLKALAAEGVPASGGYTPLTNEPFLRATLQSKGYRAIYAPERIEACLARFECPANERVCREAVWFSQTMLLGPRGAMDQIAEAIRKVRAHAAKLAKA